MAKGCGVEDPSSPEVPSVSHNRCSHTVLCPSQKEPSSVLTLQQEVPWPPSQQSSPSSLFYSWHLNCSTFQLGKKASLSGACRSQVVSIPRARQDTELPVRVNTESHAKHLSFWLGLNSQYSLWKGRHFTETERLFSSGLEATWTFNHIWNPVRLKAAHFVGRMYTQISPHLLGACSLTQGSAVQEHNQCGCSAPQFVSKTPPWDNWRSSWTYPKPGLT